MKSTSEGKTDISYESIGKFEETRFEKIHNKIFKNASEASLIVAQEIAQLIVSKQAENKYLSWVWQQVRRL
ncbi:glucosamine-6-phosphate deaminase [Flavobacterium omnivorum]|uniref:Glucosamine-6-phosphate deaminase n=1 Tax=Flavobacterium omnivorum TaxID=178355 RepID=A0A1G8FH28_9FLAO|nr:glucosamine-6-phosphate deaminase [Flavobacterium omnivorum]